MEDAYSIREATKGFGKNQVLILKALYLSPQPVKQFSSVKDTVLNLQDRGLIKLEDSQVFLTGLGQAVCESWQEQKDAQSSRLPELDSEGRKDLPKLNKLRQAKLEKSNQLLELYKQGLNRQQIGDQYGISRERVRQILNINPAFHEYLKECEEAEAAAEEEKKESAKQELYSRSLAALYPERVAELWDYERNGDLKLKMSRQEQSFSMYGLSVQLMDTLGRRSPTTLLQAGREVEPADVRCVQVGRKRLRNSLLLQKFIQNSSASTGITKKITSLT